MSQCLREIKSPHVTDYLGTSLATIDAADASEVENLLVDSMGQGTKQTDTSARFTGKPYDADLGAFVFPYRNYDPEAARWLTSDPAGFPDGPNSHYYAPVPTTGLDALGLNALSPYHVDLQDDITDMITDSQWGTESAHEEGGWIVYDEDQDEYSIDRWEPDPANPDGISPTPRPDNAVGDIHTHPVPNDGPSPGDLPYKPGDKVFVINPNEVWQVLDGGKLLKWPKSPSDAWPDAFNGGGRIE